PPLHCSSLQSCSRHRRPPRSPLSPYTTLFRSAVAAVAAADPNFPWADYDVEDQGDRDGDGNVFEPDGVIDHLVLVHAGEDKSGRSEEHTSELQSHENLVCRLLLEKKKQRT